MRVVQAYRIAANGFDRVIGQVPAPAWDAATPCTEWTARDLVNHVVAEQLWAPHLLRGETLEQVGDRYDGDVVGADPVAAWTPASNAAVAAFDAPGAMDQRVHVTFGVIDAEEYAWQMTTDLAVHGWDLAVAVGAPPPVSAELAVELLGIVEQFVDPGSTGHDGIFAPPQPVAADAPAVDRLVAQLGRPPDWRPHPA